MSLRTKLVAALAALSIAASAGIGVFSYRATESRLNAEVDRSLDDAAASVLGALDGRGPNRAPGRGPGGARPFDLALLQRGFDLVSVQVLDEEGEPLAASAGLEIPIDDRDRHIAGSGSVGTARRDATIDDVSYRILTQRRPTGGAVQVARRVDETQRVLDSLRTRIALLVLIVGGGAAACGWLVARQITRRLTTLTEAAERVADTGRLDIVVPTEGGDEAGRLGLAFSAMLAALADARSDQQRLVQDAGHELRTPLTSLRTNVSVLRRFAELSPEELGRLLDDLDGESRELTDLVNELVELATDRRDDEPEDEVDMAALVARVAERSRRRTGREIRVRADDVVVAGRSAALERAVGNLLDNAAKFDAGGTETIEVAVLSTAEGRCRVEVSDRGPGIAPEDLRYIFDRFYRATSARSRPGSGLGLSIVEAVAELHGGKVVAHNRDGGGATIGFELPTT